MATVSVLDFTKPHVLRNAREFKAAVAEIDRLLDMDPKRGSDEYDRLEFLSVLVQAYEDDRDRIDECHGSPQSVVAFMLEQHGMSRAQLVPIIGGMAAPSRPPAIVVHARLLVLCRRAYRMAMPLHAPFKEPGT